MIASVFEGRRCGYWQIWITTTILDSCGRGYCLQCSPWLRLWTTSLPRDHLQLLFTKLCL